jgi:cyclopropane fatty-acyl-phospholipid synthase-like methyltransferase
MISQLLALPFVYDLTQVLIRGEGYATRFVKRFVKPKPGDRILDIGCGTGAMLPHLIGTDYVGFDMSRRYIDACRRRYGNRGSFHCERLTATTAKDFGQFNIVLAVGVVHHLDDADAARLFQLARDSLVKGGKLVTLDGVFQIDQPWGVRWLLQNDRGKYVRTAEEYLRLARAEFGKTEEFMVDDLFRIPYSLLVMNCYS